MNSYFFNSTLRNRLTLLAAGIALISSITFSYTQAVEAAPSDDLTELTTNFNRYLKNELEDLESALPDISIASFDANTFFANELPMTLTETTQSCVQGPPLAPASSPVSICVDPAEYLFFDEIHPTATVHGLMGERIIGAINRATRENISELFIFGDSLSDFRNVFGFSGETFPPRTVTQGPLLGSPLYASGRFTNGRLWWSQLLSEYSISSPTPYYQEVLKGSPPSLADGSINFAVGGATTGTDNAGNAQSPPFPVELPGLKDQIDDFESLALSGGGADPDALYVIWAGPNNFLGAFIPIDPANPFGPFTDFTTDVAQPVDDIVVAIEDLYNLGARKFLVNNMYDMGATPLAQDIDILFP
ncbi:hypothetical protein S7335_2672 [Synechococcus sp. PCC 7335]|uniref:SGNH/GDSL hydrolase family protein n=1 Tax=Synechococcus sp. (strain ATCC 29403 / PCC 7335) TaxID=91464 RepID=UPI00017EE47F|nr:SGNH/GDSL hydrolase family protein [Synechococcus sp. PCC 7335]EDX84973.1 hypothetical protein S7335_2672 [Synechococcus sp. PCC 7335]